MIAECSGMIAERSGTIAGVLGNDRRADGNDRRAVGNQRRVLGNQRRAVRNDRRVLGNDCRVLGIDCRPTEILSKTAQKQFQEFASETEWIRRSDYSDFAINSSYCPLSTHSRISATRQTGNGCERPAFRMSAQNLSSLLAS